MEVLLRDLPFCPTDWIDTEPFVSNALHVSATGKDSEKRHRHDVGEVSHGAVTHETVTRAIQYTLALTVIGSALLVVYALSASALAH